jgi:hypothetical protein
LKRHLLRLAAVTIPLLALKYLTSAYSGTVSGAMLQHLGIVAYAGAGFLGHLTAVAVEYGLECAGYKLS